MTAFPVHINEDLLYRAPDGREAFVVFDADGHAHFGSAVTDGPYPTSVGFTVQALSELVDMMRERQASR
jgi:hypothetical protein